MEWQQIALPPLSFVPAKLSKANDAALALVEAFSRAVPQSKSKRLSEAEWSAALERFNSDALIIRRKHSLGVFGRAMAAYHFQKQLLASSMDAEVVRKVVFSMVLNAFIAKA